MPETDDTKRKFISYGSPWILLNAISGALGVLSLAEQMNPVVISKLLRNWIDIYRTFVTNIFIPVDFIGIDLSETNKQFFVLFSIFSVPFMRFDMIYKDITDVWENTSDFIGENIGLLIGNFLFCQIFYFMFVGSLMRLTGLNIDETEAYGPALIISGCAIGIAIFISEAQDRIEYLKGIVSIFGVFVLLMIINIFFI